MVIAVITMLVMQATIYQKVEVVAMWYEFVPTVDVITFAICRCALSRIGFVHLDNVFIVMIGVSVMQVSIMQVIDMVTMLDACMATEFVVCMCMKGMDFVCH